MKTVIPRQILTILVFALPIFFVAFGVLMGGSLLADGVSDADGALWLKRLAMACLMLVIGDIVLLVGVLGIAALDSSDDRRGPNEGDS